MAESKTKKPPVVLIKLPLGVARFPHTRKPDTEGQFASGKFDCEVVFPGDTDFSGLEKTIKAEARKMWPNLDLDELQLPWRFRDEDDKDESLRNKYTSRPKSGYAPKLYDAKRVEIEDPKVEVWGGDEVKVLGSLYLFEKVEQVVDAKTKKKTNVTGYYATLRLMAVQIVKKRSGGGTGGSYANAFDDEEGYESSGSEFADSGSNSTVDDGADF
jgi:hypothetical protein